MQKTAEWRKWLTEKDPVTGIERRTDFGRWVGDMAQGSEVTADENARKLAYYCARVKTTPDALAARAKADPRAVLDELMDLIHDLTSQGKAGSYVQRYVVAVVSWLRHHGVELPKTPKVRGSQLTPTLADECVPTQGQLRQVLHLASPRGRVAISLIAFSGVRPEVLGNMRGTDGLKLGDFPELRLDGPEGPRFDVTPARVHVRAPISKTRRPYLTFLPGEGCEALLAYLRMRAEGGEKLSSASPVIQSNEHYGHAEGFIWTRNVTREIRAALRASGIKNRPYVLRAYHSTALLTAESRQGLPHAYATHWAGHVGDMDARYSVNKRLPSDLVEDMRKRYAAACEFIGTNAKALDDGAAKRIAALEDRIAAQARELDSARRLREDTQERIAALVEQAVKVAMATEKARG